MLSLAKALQPHVWLNVHSGMEAMFTPWDHKAEVRWGSVGHGVWKCGAPNSSHVGRRRCPQHPPPPPLPPAPGVCAQVPAAAQYALGVLQQIHSDYFTGHKECVVGSGGKSVGCVEGVGRVGRGPVGAASPSYVRIGGGMQHGTGRVAARDGQGCEGCADA